MDDSRSYSMCNDLIICCLKKKLGVVDEFYTPRNYGNNRNLYGKPITYNARNRLHGGNKSVYSFDIRRPWISWADPTFWSSLVQFFVDYVENLSFM